MQILITCYGQSGTVDVENCDCKILLCDIDIELHETADCLKMESCKTNVFIFQRHSLSTFEELPLLHVSLGIRGSKEPNSQLTIHFCLPK